MKRSPVAVALLASLVLAGPASAQPTPKKAKPPKPACDLAYLPFTPGATWVYTFFMTADAPAGVYVKDPDTIQIKVLEIAQAGGETAIKLEESYRKVVVNTELRCSKDGGVQVPLNSFFFFGEPGGGLTMELVDLKRTGQRELPGAKMAAGDELFEEIVAGVVRAPSTGSNAKLPKASLELERKALIGGREDVESKMASHDSQRIDVTLTGRANLEGQPKEKEFNMPESKAAMFFARGFGLVRVEGSSGKGWQLSQFTDGTVPLSPPPAEAPATPAPGAAPAAPATPAP